METLTELDLAKTEYGDGTLRFSMASRALLYGWKPGASHNWFADRKQTTVLEFDRPSRSTEHSTIKSIELVEYCVGNSSEPGDIVHICEPSVVSCCNCQSKHNRMDKIAGIHRPGDRSHIGLRCTGSCLELNRETNELILSELRELRADYNDNTRKTGERLSSLESQMYSLCGNGQPGRVWLQSFP